MSPLVAVSAAYGAAGSRIGPLLAERLEVPFVDRAIPVAVAERLDIPLDEALSYDEGTPRGSLLERLLSAFAGADNATVPSPPPAAMPAAGEEFAAACEAVIREQARSGGGVILGRGAVAVLRDDPGVLRVRLTGDPEQRVRMAMWLGGAEEAAARAALRRLDAAHAQYLRRFYGVAIDDPSLYHLVLDVPALGTDACVEIVLAAVRAHATGRVTGQPAG